MLVGLAGGSFFYALHIPLPWMLGSLFATALAVLLGRDWLMPPLFRNAARPVIGVLAGSAFTPVVVIALAESWDVILYAASYSVIITILGFFFFKKICRYDVMTSFFCSTPGGLGELIMIGSQLGGNIRTMVFVHTIRISAVVFIVPAIMQFFTDIDLSRPVMAAHAHVGMDLIDWLIIGACCAAGFITSIKFRNLSGGAIFVPLALSAALHATGVTQAVPPQWMVGAVQIVIGASAGARFAGIGWAEVRRTLVHAVVWAVAMIGVAALMAVIGSMFFDRTFSALLLAAAPGGLPEMTIIAYAIGIDVAFVVTCHVCRVILVIVAGAQTGAWLARRQKSVPEA
ncbi:monooxygenase [Terrihabitans soli]|uniref:Monooxygenase n=2 Tax=Terrihabitans soli TaxID=708113 RepID=A0A6S6QLH1_9HYPH|nr:monooxygenase [Terrihabitans soli]